MSRSLGSRVGRPAEGPELASVGSREPDDLGLAFDRLVESGPLHVAFQPIVDVTRGTTLGYEVLGRCGPLPDDLAHLGRGPSSLLDAASACGRLLALDRRWRALAVDAIAAHGDGDTLYFFNVDPRVTESPAHAAGFTRELIANRGLDPRRFVLELTEATSLDRGSIERVLDDYRRQGFAIALDDWGAPLQSLAILLRLRPDYVKIDAALIRGIENDPLRQHLLRALVDFSERSQVKLVVEGIETEQELAKAREAGAQLVQGFLLGRPAPAPAPLSPPVATSLRGAHGRWAGKDPRFVEEALVPIVELLESIASTSELEAALQHVTAFAAELLGVERVSVRLLDESRTRLLVAARTGASLHASAYVDFAVGEGLVGWVVANKKPLRVSCASDDPRFVHRPDMTEPMGSFLGVPLLDERGSIGVLATSTREPMMLSLEHERRLRLVAAIVSPRLQVARLRRLLVTDPLTCVWNRRGFEEVLPKTALTSMLSLAVVDIDAFKSINDRLGHAGGDEVLPGVANALVSVLRETDQVVRMGGDEFLLILRGATREDAFVIAERARIAVMSRLVAPPCAVTVSIGVATKTGVESRDELCARADRSLYRAKANGRNRVEVDGGANPVVIGEQEVSAAAVHEAWAVALEELP